MSDDTITIEVDGKEVEARKGQMLIEVTDALGAYVPRFCYHPKLTVAANCRMCLVEVEKAPKPLPACATPVMDGMKVFTRSSYAIEAQKATMEFLLINHPLDCPICDQGGECELQDIAMGYGRDISRFNERKRVVKDKDIGPLVSTDMTRCIHCTRCVRFGEEVMGQQQLGTTDRGENMQIGTFVEQAVDHELSANIIDLCPVGALNNKPYRYSARSWEMTQKATVSPHDCVGSNLYAHVLRGTIKRVVPRENEAINETWLADRDRFSYEAVYSDDRLLQPLLKEGGEWREIDWEDALQKAAETLAASGDNTGFLLSPSATSEEGHLAVRLSAHLGTANIDHRLRRRDFSDQTNDPLFPFLGVSIEDVERQDAILLVGSRLRREAPILAHRVRKATLNGAIVSVAAACPEPVFYDVANELSGAGLVELLSGVAVAAAADGKALPVAIEDLCDGVTPSDTQRAVAASLADAVKGLVLLGNVAGRHGAYSAVRALAAAISELTGATFGTLSEGANAAGLSLVGALPHRERGGAERDTVGLDTAAQLEGKLDALVLLNAEPDADISAVENAAARLAQHGFVIALTPFDSASLRDGADLMLPVGTFAETSGTYVNVEGRQQSFEGIANPVGEARPAWKVLRVLGNLLEAEGFDYVTSRDVLAEIDSELDAAAPDNAYRGTEKLLRPNGEDAPAAEIDVPARAQGHRLHASSLCSSA
jgi:NADH-quinone oxidoreductase subunit G